MDRPAYARAVATGPSFKLGGIPIRVDVTFLIVAALLGIGARSGIVAWVAIVFFSVLIHELGHAVAFRRYGVPPEILLQGLGGLTTGTPTVPLKRAQNIVMSLAGPLTGLVLVGLPALWYSRAADGLSPTADAFLSDLVWVNLAWSLLNLLPILPLDGGQVAANLMAKGEDDGWRKAHILSAAVAAVLGVYALTRGYPFGLLYAGFFAAYNLSRLTAYRNVNLQAELGVGWLALARGETDAAEAAAAKVLADRPSAATMVGANELMAWSRLAGGDAAAARRAIERYPPGESPDPMLLAALELEDARPEEALNLLDQAYRRRQFGPAAPMVANAVAQAGLDRRLADRFLSEGGAGPDAAALFAAHLHVAGRYDQSIAAGARAFQAGSGDRGQLAYNLACSFARSGDVDNAFRWLSRAVGLGFKDAALFDKDPDLAALRGDDRYDAVRRQLAPGA